MKRIATNLSRAACFALEIVPKTDTNKHVKPMR